ncbi:outer membrane receptor protein involved in Fe transport [Tenacibaculum adriaticum]|uniref:Outer membrane receptor protein involved in Fe transport n=1 Tax=Tenacibaculum adriaticum TaxID=413713 RepID=A0A5S5DUM3_9FLAO|nr:TonB-dependent receptor [Tenacibaculum adriaticum]TYP99607.1 outer membrane receptor protein involved in Fe transport [Tenacibaculum adriaticum]
MKQIIISVLFGFFLTLDLPAQNIIKGVVKNSNSEYFMEGVSVSVKETEISQVTGADGVFVLQNISNGEYIVVLKKNGYETQNYPVKLSGDVVDLGIVFMYEDELYEEQDLSTITITDDELSDDTSGADNISGLLQASRDVYSRTAAFEWSPSFYRIRGLDSENGKVLINGVEMNKLYNGRPQWSNWGGLNDVLRNQEFSNGFTPSNYTFGGALGSTNISTRASEYREGGRVSYASSNRSYTHRVMATYASGVLEDGWAFAISGSRRAANEGFVDGTSYNAFSTFASIEKIINDEHSLNLTSIFASNRRGKSAPNTQEVYDIKGIKYNPYWGYQNGKIRNSRIKDVEEPILMLNHYWNISDKTQLKTSVAYQFGEIGNSRIDYNGARLDQNGWPVGGGSNPDPTYYQNMPSTAIRDEEGNEYALLQNLINDGQLNWNELYRQNITRQNSTNSIYIQYEDRNDDKQFTVNTILNTELTDNITLNASLDYKKLKSENFANVLDLLGGEGYLDVDTFGSTFDEKQNDLLNPNRIVGVGDRFKYNYNLNSEVYTAFAQGQFKYNKVDFYLAGNVSRTSHQREGLYLNGSFPTNSLGNSEKLEFTNYGVKAGATFKLSGRHLVDINAGYLTKAPSLRNSFSNSRENNNVVRDLTSEKILSGDFSYILRSPIVQTKVTTYYTKIQNATEIAFYYTDGLSTIQEETNDDSGFVQEILTGADKKHFGVELGIEVQATPTIKLKGAANIGQYTYDNNPNVYLTSDRFEDVLDLNESTLKDYKLATGPQKAYSLGFEYRDPDYWWVGATVNYLDDIYVDVAPITRTNNFYQDTDGLPFSDYDPVVARQLLAQEKFEAYTVVNAVGGKSWKIGEYYISLFGSINNLFNKEYKTGGFEQSRNASYRNLKNDKELDTPVFGNKYWYGRGTTYFINVNFRF